MTESSGSFELYNTAPNPMRVLNSDYKYDAAGGPSKFQTYQIPSSNGTSLNVSYTFPVDARQILDSYMTETYQCVLNANINSTAAVATRPLVDGNIGPTPFCIDQATNTTTITLNNIPFSFSPQDILTAMTTFNNPSDSMGYCATDVLDVYASFPTAGAATFDSQFASLKNPLLSYFSSTYKNIGRNATIQNIEFGGDGAGGIFNNTAFAGAGDKPITISFTITVPVLHPMLCVSPADSRGYIGLRNNVTLARQYLANAGQQMLEYISPGAAITMNVQPTLTLKSAPVLTYQLYNLNSYDIIPRKMYYDYSQFGQVIYSSTMAAAITSNTPSMVSINNINLTRIPKYMYIYVDNGLSSSKTTSDSRTPGFQIQGLSLSYSQGGQGIFSNMNAIQLYQEFGVKQGNVKAFCETGFINNSIPANNDANADPIGGYGTVLRIPGEYLQADWSKYSVGSTLSATINITVTCISLFPEGVDKIPVLKFIACDHSVVEIDTETGNTQILSPEFLSSRHVEELRHEKREDSVVPMFGGLLKHLKSKLISVRGKLHGKGLAELEHKNDSYDSNEVVGFKGGKLIRKSDLVGRKCY